jgi:hypothetical protein
MEINIKNLKELCFLKTIIHALNVVVGKIYNVIIKLNGIKIKLLKSNGIIIQRVI